MDKILEFLTKELVNEAVAIIDKEGFPENREGSRYAVLINNKKYPFKLLVTEAAKIAQLIISTNDFSSSKANRNGFQELTGYPIIAKNDEIDYVKFKKLLEYFTTHLEWVENKVKIANGYEIYLKEFIEDQSFKMTGQGWDGAGIQKQIEKWESYATGKICINIQGNYGSYTSVKCYLNWQHTGINILAKWKNGKIVALYQDEFIYWEKPTRRINSGKEYTIDELKLFDRDVITTELEDFFKTFEDRHELLKRNQKKEKLMETVYRSKNILIYKKQIILQGPPGTGKTREAKLIAKEMLGLNDVDDLKDSDQFKLIQFHPSYTYEDFVRGIVAESKGEKIEYKNVNKTLGLFAEKAFKNYKASNNTSSESNIEQWVDSKFEEFKSNIQAKLPEEQLALSGDITIYEVTNSYFKYAQSWQTPGYLKFSEFKNLIKAIVLGEFELTNKQLDKEKFIHAHYRYTYYNALLKIFFDEYNYQGESYSEPQKNYVLIIDEINRANLSSVLGELIYALEYRGETVESMYAINEDNKLILPPNLYIIGTMNTADRSVGHIDYAIRRRFAFIDIPAENLKVTQRLEAFDGDLFDNVTALFDTNLSAEFEKKDVQLGHSYFIDKANDKDGASMHIRLEYEIKPILKEYVRDGILTGENIKEKIEALAPSI
jgi:MoxR-like ATPase